MTTIQYIEKLNNRFKTGISTEHTFRGDLQTLLETLSPNVQVTNEPTRIACGAPDYIISKNGIPIGYIEAKDIGTDLKNKGLKEQFDRYRASLNNLIITDYLTFEFFKDGSSITSISIGRIDGNKILPNAEKFPEFEGLIKDFCLYEGQTIKSSKKLAEMMAGKAKLLAVVIENALTADLSPEEGQANEEANNTLRDQLKAFQDILIHDITPKEFADIYAQTIAYGMFAARLHDPDLKTFSRVEAADQIPKSNPFLRKLFQYVAGYDLDNRIKWIVDALADIFRATDVRSLVTSFSKGTKQQDPIIHFYETFLSEYDPKLRKARGVWYTPEPVVNFIVRAVDDILKSEFDLSQGLADNSKTKIKVNIQGKKVEQEIHKVQILDPATGTGTFLAEVIKQVYNKFRGQEGIWSSYVEKDLIPRLNGFEILMASYAMAHLKLDLLLTETNYKPQKDQRFRVYLTNSLEEYHPETGTLFANWLSAEANEANYIKRDTPVMCVIGNPPYSVSSNNKSKWIEKLTYDYKQNLNERNIQPLSDDYIKFIKFGQYLIDKNGNGILAYISNNSFIDGLIHRQMRKNLLDTFDTIYILDLHGSVKKNETTFDGGRDENVFDIQQGVSIGIFVKNNKKKKNELSKVYHFGLYGKRELKYEFLSFNTINNISWNLLNCSLPNFFFIKKDFSDINSYETGFKIDDLFKLNACGIVTARDNLVVHQQKNNLENVIRDFEFLEENAFRLKYNAKADSRDWTYLSAKKDLKNAIIQRIDYRPFDKRFIIYSSKSKGILSYPRYEVMKHMISKDNLALLVCKQQSTFDFQHAFITKTLTDKCTVSLQTKEATYHLPLYLYNETKDGLYKDHKEERIPNLNKAIVNEIEKKLNITFQDQKTHTEGTFSPVHLLDYVYAILYSPKYRKKYKEFLKIDFPRIPYPIDKVIFWELVKLGSELRQIHLMESMKLDKLITTFPKNGSNKVEVVKFEMYLYGVTLPNEDGSFTYPDYCGDVRINENQIFSQVPLSAWEFYIGGYQPAQKWLKDRKGRTLTFDEVLHYQKIIVALKETDRIMKEIDKIELV